MIVLKFGGTSVGSPDRIKSLSSLFPDEPCIVVLSAVSGTTNALVELVELLKQDDKKTFDLKVESLHKHYHQFIEELYSTDTHKLHALEMLAMHM